MVHHQLKDIDFFVRLHAGDTYNSESIIIPEFIKRKIEKNTSQIYLRA